MSPPKIPEEGISTSQIGGFRKENQEPLSFRTFLNKR